MPKPPPTTTLNRKPTPKNPRGRLPPSRKPPRPGNKTAKSSTPNEPGHSSKPCAPKRNNSRRRRSRQQRQSPRRRPQNLPRKRAPKNPSRKNPPKRARLRARTLRLPSSTKSAPSQPPGWISLLPRTCRREPPKNSPSISSCYGLIPARAGTPLDGFAASAEDGAHPRSRGNTHCPEAQRRNFRAHPHTRGEHVSHPRRFNEKKGSSPLPRGTHLLVNLGAGEVGLIPARAGNTSARRSKIPARRAHPRSRGEH